VFVFACAFVLPEDVVGADAAPVGLDVALDGELVEDVLLVWRVDDSPVDFVADDSELSGLDDQ
jgi:hypothetical protein